MRIGKRFRTVLAVLLAVMLTVAPALAEAGQTGYTLDRVVVLSRHNIRSPLSGKGSVLIGDETDPYRACCLNVEHCVDQISHALDIDHLRHGNDPAVVGAIYHIDDGHVEFL